MPSDSEIRVTTTALGFRIKRNNLIAASFCGTVLTLIALKLVPHAPLSATGFLIGLALGILYANGFEYCLHRFLLHAGHGIFGDQHMVHHTTLHAPEVARYVNFSSNPWGVVALFVANALPFLAIEWLSGAGWVAGVFPSFALYYMAFEEIHWRTHMGGWMPGWLRPAARHHLIHHAHGTERFNVFLPLFDWIIEPLEGSRPSHTEKPRV